MYIPSFLLHSKLLLKFQQCFFFAAGQPIPPVSLNPDPDSCYIMNQPHGYALIINNRNFTGRTREGYILNERRGSQVDMENLENLWKKLGFTLVKYENLKAHQICTAVDKMVKKIEETQISSCFVCCIMTHGSMGTIYGSDSNFVNIKDITDSFKEAKCPTLEGKPKLFFIQACRGREYLTGRAPVSSDTASPATETTCTTTQEQNSSSASSPKASEGLDSDASPAEVTDEDQYDTMNDSAFRHNADPNEAHFLLGYSTAPGDSTAVKL